MTLFSTSRQTSNSGITLVELLLVIAIFSILVAGSLGVLANIRDDSALKNETDNVLALLREAQNKTVASQEDTRYGVYFNTATDPHEYILFQTESDYASRDPAADEIYRTSQFVRFSNFTGNLSGQEVVFDRIQGTTSNNGEVTLQNTVEIGETTIISVSGGGVIEAGGNPVGDEGNCTSDTPSGDRLCDSRHTHITYDGRTIDTTTPGDEKILLDFGTVDETIIVTDNLSGGQIVWEGTIEVDGENQTIKIHTHKLNDSLETIFSVHRDRRFNSKSLTISLSKDTSGTLISYNASGDITPGTSVYVTVTEQQ